MGLRRLARWIGSGDFKTHEEFCSRHQLLRYSTHQAAREQRPRRSRNELIQGPLSNLRVLKLRVLRWQKGKVFQEWSGDLKFDHLTLECLLLSPLVESNEVWQ